MSAEQTAFIFFSGLSLVLVLLPLPWHWSARNYGTLLYIGWTFVGNLIYFVNAIVWTGNLGNPAPIWCDITAKLAMGLGVALPAVSLCINRRLYNIATMKVANLSPRERLYQTLIDFSIGLGLPFLVMALHYVVQGHRFNIMEDVGCVPTTYVTPLMIPLVTMWPPILGLISMVYGGLAIHAFLKQRRTFNSVLNANNSNLNVSRYLRLIALAGTDILLDLPLSIFIAWSNIKPGMRPWISWADTHYNFSYVAYVPIALVKMNRVGYIAININRWALPTAAILFFMYFGLAGESLAAYRRALEWCATPFSRFRRSRSRVVPNDPHRPLPSATSSAATTLPRFPRSIKRDVDVESALDASEEKWESEKLSSYTSPNSDPPTIGESEHVIELPTPHDSYSLSFILADGVDTLDSASFTHLSLEDDRFDGTKAFPP